MKSSFIASIALTAALLCGCTEKRAFAPMEIEGLEPTPEFWKVKPEQIIDICKNLKVGRSEVIATTPFGYPVYACFYGDFSEDAPHTNWSAGNSSTTIDAYLGTQDHKQTLVFLAGVHGAEPEGVAAATNFIRMLETGADFRGQTDTTLLRLAGEYRIIVIPCLNMDGRSLSPDHLHGQPYEVFRAACQGTWKDGSLVGWKNSKEYFPLPLDKVSYPGGYPNGDGYNIMHDVAPGDMRTEEAKALCKLLARWRADFVLNAHSCESQPHMIGPSQIDIQRHVDRAADLAERINHRLFEMGLRTTEVGHREPTETINLTTIVNLCSGGFGLTLECSSSYDNIHQPTILYTFDQMIEPVFVSLKIVMEDGLKKPLAERPGSR